MKKIFVLGVLLVLLAGGMALDKEDCEEYSDHIVCDQAGEFTDEEIAFEDDATCYYEERASETNSFVSCRANASAPTTFEYQDCNLYLPLNGTDLDYLNVDYQHNCQDKKLGKDTEIFFIGFNEFFDDCAQLENATPYRVEKCKIKGENWIMSGRVKNANGTWTVNVAEGEQKEEKGMERFYIYGAVLAGLIIVYIIWKNKES